MKLLELFKGTGSVGKVISKLYPDSEIISLDILKKYNPTHCCDIMDFDYKQYPVGYFDILWASPECKVYSTLQGSLNINRWGDNREEQKANLEKARRNNDKFVLRTLDIINYLKPKKWFIENPWNSNMRTIPQLKALPSYRFDYCRFGFDYQKPTRIWSNQPLESMKCECRKKKNKKAYEIPEGLVEHLVKSPLHKKNIGINKGKRFPDYNGGLVDANTKQSAYEIPEGLVEHLVKSPLHKQNNGKWNKDKNDSTEVLYRIPEALITYLIDP